MNRLMPCTFPLSFCLAVVAVALALVACGGSMRRESVTSAPVVESAPSAVDNGTVSESGVDKVPVCHKGVTKMVPQGAVEDHLGHDDTRGACCPCFSANEINAAAMACGGEVLLPICMVGASASLVLICASSEARVLGDYRSSSAGGICSQRDMEGNLTSAEVSADQHLGCVNEMESTPYCP